jgi:methylenetetrahydrofolate reductase (NADPH)
MIKSVFENKRSVSLEVFPPKKDGEFEKAYETLAEMAKLSPDYISVTYGAGGSNSKRTIEIASYIQNTLKIDAIAHMTCVGNKKEQILSVCDELASHNI